MCCCENLKNLSADEYIRTIEGKLQEHEAKIKTGKYRENTLKWFGVSFRNKGSYRAKKKAQKISFTGALEEVVVAKDEAILELWEQIPNPVLNQPSKYKKQLRKFLG